MKKLIEFFLNFFRKKEEIKKAQDLKFCAFCYKTIEGAKQKKFCSESCKKKAKYKRQKALKMVENSL